MENFDTKDKVFKAKERMKVTDYECTIRLTPPVPKEELIEFIKEEFGDEIDIIEK